LNEHCPVWVKLSATTHVTHVVPREKRDPETGVQVSVTGATPPLTVGAANSTSWDPLRDTRVDTSAGQVMVGGLADGVGITGSLPHATNSSAATAIIGASTNPAAPPVLGAR
jgi:hypothetical protein